jgi:hypothetical protein
LSRLFYSGGGAQRRRERREERGEMEDGRKIKRHHYSLDEDPS